MYLGYLPLNTIEEVHFSVGVPPNLNTSSGQNAQDIATYSAENPLSFQEPSMYWGWTAGYMHMILGGMADSNNDGIVDYTFELHNLGDANYRGVQMPVVATETSANQLDVYLDCNLEQWMKDIPIETVGILHGTSGSNMEILKNIETEPVFTQNNFAGITAMNQECIVFIDQSSQKPVVHWKEMVQPGKLWVVDMAGKKIIDMNCEEENGSFSLPELPSGTYTVTFTNANDQMIRQLRFVR